MEDVIVIEPGRHERNCWISQRRGQQMPINHLLCENRRTAGRIGEDGLSNLLVFHTLSPHTLFSMTVREGQ